ncbi:MAG TPA: hypothetical protein VJ826_02115, partial [Candidatus Polarisedimenticolaceae bacterium]|nr:hypothetical protein [Candidatus Polarisedimenticolaceae bacterium]
MMHAQRVQAVAAAVFVADGLLLAAAWLGAYEIRFHVLGLPAPRGVPPRELYLWFASFIAPLGLLVLHALGAYRPDRLTSGKLGVAGFAQGALLTTALAALASYFTRGEIARSVMPIFAVLATLVVCLNRLVLRAILRRLRRDGRMLCCVLIVGTGPAALALARKMTDGPDGAHVLQGLLSAEPMPPDTAIAGVRVVGSVADLPRIVERYEAE